MAKAETTATAGAPRLGYLTKAAIMADAPRAEHPTKAGTGTETATGRPRQDNAEARDNRGDATPPLSSSAADSRRQPATHG